MNHSFDIWFSNFQKQNRASVVQVVRCRTHSAVAIVLSISSFLIFTFLVRFARRWSVLKIEPPYCSLFCLTQKEDCYVHYSSTMFLFYNFQHTLRTKHETLWETDWLTVQSEFQNCSVVDFDLIWLTITLSLSFNSKQCQCQCHCHCHSLTVAR